MTLALIVAALAAAAATAHVRANLAAARRHAAQRVPGYRLTITAETEAPVASDRACATITPARRVEDTPADSGAVGGPTWLYRHDACTLLFQGRHEQRRRPAA